ncbi:hypothetical protein WMF27_09315 [Sorangium sp. So ce281]|uniref:hypothetical protein n=1 Tax=unclassified Sorangium TaxID=2621164 RepID=UPI003F63A8EA
MKRFHIMGLVGAAALAITSGAFAGYWNPVYTVIDNLDTVPGIGYRVYTATTENPASCANTGYLDPHSTIPAAERQLMDRTLLSAFLAGRKVKFNISSQTCTAEGYPTYVWLRLDKAQ